MEGCNLKANHQADRCAWTGCPHASSSSLGGRSFCIEHFVAVAQTRLAVVRQGLSEADGDRLLPTDSQKLLSEVISQTTVLAAETRQLHPAMRENLLSLSQQAASLFRRIARPPRINRRILCLLRTGLVSSEVSERCVTRNISERGACLELKRPQRVGSVGSVVTLEKQETKETCRVRISWINPESPGLFAAGVEVLDHTDFWGLGSSKTVMIGPKEQ